MSGDETPPPSHAAQIAGLTKSISKHDELLESLKGVPALLKQLVGSTAGDDRESITDDASSGNRDDVDRMLNSNQEESDEDCDPELLAAFKEIEGEVQLGPAIKTEVAECFEKAVRRPLQKESLGKLTSELKLPENCKSLAVPKMNQEIWTHLPPKARVQDLGLQSQQQCTSFGLIALANLADKITKNSSKVPKEFSRELISMIRDAANVLGNGFQSLNLKRRAEVKPFIKTEFSGICSAAAPVTEFLFGDDLKESLKSSKAASLVVRQSFSKQGNYRPQPYHNPRKSSYTQGPPLNWNRPSQQQQRPHFRGGWKSNYQRPGSSGFQKKPFQTHRQ